MDPALHVSSPSMDGCWVVAYVIAPGHETDAEVWGMSAMMEVLHPSGRSYPHRTPLYAAFHDLVFSFVTASDTLQPKHAMDHPFEGLVVEIYDAASNDYDKLVSWLKNVEVPRRLTEPVGMCLAMHPRPFPVTLADAAGFDVRSMTTELGHHKSVCSGCFGQTPMTSWQSFRSSVTAVPQDIGERTMLAPFIPTVNGTNRYVNQLRS
jgi:hypothetical protein